jgi:hypothetical protein
MKTLGCFVFISCKTAQRFYHLKTTKIIYNSNTNCNLKKIGIADIDIKDNEYYKKFPHFDSIFNLESIMNSKIFLSNEAFHVNENFIYQQVFHIRKFKK